MSASISASESLCKVEAVVIGASAGGVEAIAAILDALPASFTAAVIIVLHLPPDRPTALPQLFGKRARLPVKEAEDKEIILGGAVYLAPPGYHLLVEPDKRFSLSLDEAEHFSRPSIDLLFESAAYAYREKLLGIVLTGASVDGAAGLRTVRTLGGLAWVQDPADASMSIMPAAAIAEAGADSICSLTEIILNLSRLDYSEYR
jgi:two-component system, chemotaxis family, protein-glutamate methylesterase/glutaminase